MVAQPNSAAMRTAAMYILHCSSTCASVSSVSSSLPRLNFMPGPAASRRPRAPPRPSPSASSRRATDWLSRSLKTPVGCSSSSGMMALNMPMQPSSKTPMMSFSRLSFCAKSRPIFAARGGHLDLLERLHVRGVVLHLARLEPRAQALEEKRVGEILAPERAVGHARLGQRAVEVEHADEAGPRAAPVGDGEDRPAMRGQAGAARGGCTARPPRPRSAARRRECCGRLPCHISGCR